MPKLYLKRTPEEEAEHQLRKKRRKERKKGRDSRPYLDQQHSYASPSKRHHADFNDESRKWASSDEEPSSYTGQPSNTTHFYPDDRINAEKLDYDALHAELEDQRFREKMFGAMGEDERLDSIEAQFNDFAHVPDRWRTTPGSGTKARRDIYDQDDFLKLNPSALDDEEYTEWVRLGMYRKTHATEYDEKLRRKAAAAARRAEEKSRRAESKRLEKEAEEERRRKKLEHESQRWDKARVEYHARWTVLLEEVGNSPSLRELTFHDIPWPIVSAYEDGMVKRRSLGSTRVNTITPRALTKEAISTFLLPPNGEGKKERKEKLRETFLRFHPDKFDGRFMKRVKGSDKDLVKEAIGQVSRVLNHLMGEGP